MIDLKKLIIEPLMEMKKIDLKGITFIHYGTEKLKKGLFKSIKNRRCWNKPRGGIWASPLNSNHSWRKFCLDENFNIGTLKKHILFKISSNSKIYIINSYLDLINLRKYFIHNTDIIFNEITIDYEKMMKDGYDGIYLTENGEYDTRFPPCGRYDCSLMGGKLDLYGWDCESIVVFNKDIIRRVKRKRLKFSKRNYRRQSIIINTQKSNNINDPDILEWDRSNNFINNTIFIPGKHYKSVKAYYRDVEKILYETEDDPSRIVKLYGN